MNSFEMILRYLNTSTLLQLRAECEDQRVDMLALIDQVLATRIGWVKEGKAM